MGTWVSSGHRAAILLACVLCARMAEAVIIEWKPSPEAGLPGKIAGYKLYYGPQDFTNPPTDGVPMIAPFSQFVGSSTNVVITNLAGGVTYYFAAVAVDSDGIESPFSNVAMFVAPLTEPPPPPPPETNQINLTEMLPRLSLYSTNGEALLAVSGTIGATVAIQRSTNPGATNSWITITNLKLSAMAPNGNTNSASILEKAFVPALESFQDPNPIDGAFCWYRLYMPLGYVIAANKSLAQQDISSRLIAVCFPDGKAHIVCYIASEAAYVDYDDTTHIARLEQSGATIREIADKVATSLGKNWTSACEFTVADNGSKKLFAYILRTSDPATDPPLGVSSNLDLLLNF